MTYFFEVCYSLNYHRRFDVISFDLRLLCVFNQTSQSDACDFVLNRKVEGFHYLVFSNQHCDYFRVLPHTQVHIQPQLQSRLVVEAKWSRLGSRFVTQTNQLTGKLYRVSANMELHQLVQQSIVLSLEKIR